MPNYLTSIRDYHTKELVAELVKRQGVEKLTVAPHSEYTVNIDETWDGQKESSTGDGSAAILVVTD